MKSTWISLVCLFLCLTSFQLSAQVITVEPSFPTAEDSVEVVFHADRGNQELINHSGDIYAHTGVITENSADGKDWRYVIAEWTENTSKAKLEKVGSNQYKLVIKPDIRTFYGVPQDEEIYRLAFVFRNADGSVVGRSEDGGDIYADVYLSGLNVRILEPSSAPILNLGDTLSIKALSNESDSLFLYIEDTLKAENSDTVLTYEYIPQRKGNYEIVVRASNQEEEVSDTTYFHVKGNVQNASLPDNWKKGINYLADDSVGLALYAPYKEFVYVIGDFTHWKPDEDYLMHYDDSLDIYWTSIGGLDPQTQYIFQYLIDGELRIADPYSNQLSDPNDQYINEETYPDLIEYPSAKTTNIATVIQTQQEPYPWKNTDFVPPAKEELVIYELLIRDFAEKHTYKTLIDTLPYLKKLGVNAIELMPVNEFEGNSSWGYNPSFYFAPDKYYGPKEDLKAFIDTCHGKDMAVIIDMVLNHSYGQSPLVRMYFDPDAGEYGQPTPLNPWYNTESPNQTYSWGFDFDHESEQTKEFVDSVNAFWLNEYNVDGFRFDFTKGFTNTPGDGWNYDPDRIGIMKRMALRIWEENSDAYVILEHLAENKEEKDLAGFGMMLWGNMNYNYNEATMGYHDDNKSDFSGISYQERGWNKPHLVGYMESHDEERLMYKNLQYGAGKGDYDITELETALKRQQLAASFFFTVPGPKMIWQFGELGYDISIDYDCRVCPKPIKWDYLNDTNRRKLYGVYSKLIRARNKYEVFHTDDFSLSLEDTLKQITLRGEEMDVVVLGNFGLETKSISAEFTETGDWFDFFNPDTMEVDSLTKSITLAPGYFKMYTSEPTEVSDFPGFETSIFNSPSTNELKVYPNPSNHMVHFQLPEETQQRVDVAIYDMTGRKVFGRTFFRQNQLSIPVSEIKKNQQNIFIYEVMAGSKRFTGRIFTY